jgi:membrane protease YdiL (CAAX protease family)
MAMQRHLRTGFLMLLAILASVPVTAAQGLVAWLPPWPGLIYGTAITVVALALWIRWQRTAWNMALPREASSWRVLLMATLCSLTLGAAYHHWVTPDLGARLEQLADSPIRNASLVIIAFITAPLIEEALFRGFLLPQLRKAHGVTTSVLLSAIAFGFAHGDLTRVPQPAIGGLMLGAIVVCTGRLWLAAAAHSLFNLSGLVEIASVRLEVPQRLGLLYPVLCLTIAVIAALELRRLLVTTRWFIAPSPASLVAPPTTWGLDFRA